MDTVGPATDHSPGATPAGRRFLVADDEPLNRVYLRRVLAAEGYAVDVVEDGEAALQALLQGGYDLALIDMNMPGMSGLDVMRCYGARLAPNASLVPIILFTACAEDDLARAAYAAGAQAFLTKPLAVDTLHDVVHSVLADAGPCVRRADVVDVAVRLLRYAPPLVDSDALAATEELFGGAANARCFIETLCSDGEQQLLELRACIYRGDFVSARGAARDLQDIAAALGAHQVLQITSFVQRGTDEVLYEWGKQAVRDLERVFSETCRAVRVRTVS